MADRYGRKSALAWLVESEAALNARPHDTYYQNIARAASAMVRAGMAHYVYDTQWLAGTTMWAEPESSFSSVRVTKEGVVTK